MARDCTVCKAKESVKRHTTRGGVRYWRCSCCGSTFKNTRQVVDTPLVVLRARVATEVGER
jgi:ribosomal protein L37AE/L43A